MLMKFTTLYEKDKKTKKPSSFSKTNLSTQRNKNLTKILVLLHYKN
jgi:hypothetical protein